MIFMNGVLEVVLKESEATLETLVANNGPVSVAIYASSTFESYTSGAFASTDCYVNGETNHAVNVVGYLNNYDGYPVWIVRNSWGSGWGQNGYVYIRKGLTSYDGTSYPYGMCNIGMYLTQPQKPITSTLNSFGPVSNFDCSSNSTSWNCSWDSVSGATSYRFYHSSDGTTWNAVMNETTSTSFGNTEDPTNVYVAVRPMKSTSNYNQYGVTTDWSPIIPRGSPSTKIFFSLSSILLLFVFLLN
ncbi:serine-repeat antigen protein [Anaeramoeba ignava]|uniref:Serine-repeat antigen protein n=1 Tax=Anaeramoeba ignava TaxID=1746090 RepID=A0A9Q0LGY2_ANAIG|nr:serine-repeat antigen protein [Anaeramoeba ignava]